MLRIILIIGNTVYSVLLGAIIYGAFSDSFGEDLEIFLLVIILFILFILNIYFLLGIRNDLYYKRKRLEEEIKIQEAENKLKELRDKKES